MTDMTNREALEVVHDLRILAQPHMTVGDHERARQAIATLSALADRAGWQPIETAPVGKQMFVAIGVTGGNGFTGGKPYTTDPWCVWQAAPGEYLRWPHHWAPTHWMPLPAAPGASHD